jgi:pimeloyl-ACP methyl ester carboxylesterase
MALLGTNARRLGTPAVLLSVLPFAVPAVLATALPSALAAQLATGPIWTLEPGSYEAGGTEVAVDHGSLRVPADRSAPGAESITLRFVRFPSTSAAPASPLVFLAGGPGDSGTWAFRGIPPELLDRLRAVGDVIALDQRGTGTSEPQGTRCPPVSLERAETAGADGASAADAAPGPAVRRTGAATSPAPAVNPAALDALEQCVATAGDRGIVLSGLTTAESADDLEDLRIAAGAPSLRLLAGSYGTHLALSFARRHPGSVAAMALIGVEGPDDTFKLPGRVDIVLERVAAAKRPSLIADLRTLRQRLAPAPVEHPLPGGGVLRMTEWDLQRWVAESLGSVGDIDAMVAAVPTLLDGDYLPLARWSARQRMPRPVDLMNLAMDCASSASPERLERIRDEEEGSTLGDALNYPKRSLCDIPGLPRLPDEFRTPVFSNAPTLLVAGSLDGRTPVENAHEVAETLPNAEVLVVEEAAHDLFGRPEVMRRALELLAR